MVPTVVRWLALLLHSEKAAVGGFESTGWLRPFCVGSLWVLWCPPTVQRHVNLRLICDSELVVGVDGWMDVDFLKCATSCPYLSQEVCTCRNIAGRGSTLVPRCHMTNLYSYTI